MNAGIAIKLMKISAPEHCQYMSRYIEMLFSKGEILFLENSVFLFLRKSIGIKRNITRKKLACDLLILLW